MKFAFPLALSLVFGALAVPAHAQMLGGMSGGGMGGAGGGPKLQPKLQAPNPAPSGLPGLGGIAPEATGPSLAKPISGDPTEELFTAITGNDYAAAQDAVSRGADLQALDQFGETPLDLSIALNRNDITFLLLGTRNEMAAQAGPSGGVIGSPWTLDTKASFLHKGKKHPPAFGLPVKVAPKMEFPAGDLGTPDPQSGFLGFGNKN